jgi:hypothetical protein
MAVQILNRKRYERLGYVFHPSYLSMFGDDEYSLHAEVDGCVVNTDIMFPHHHWTTGERAMDDVYRRQNDPTRYQWGHAVMSQRYAAGFPVEMPPGTMEARLEVFFNAKQESVAA